MGKTDTIKDRRVDVYVDTLERKERWTEIAEEEGESLSKFVQKAVEYAIEQGGVDYGALGERSQKIQELEEQVTDLREQLKQKDIVIEKLEDDLQEYRLQDFTEEEYEGTREYNQQLIDILQSGDQVSGDEICRQLGIDPTDSQKMQAIDNQLQQLEAYGLVSSTARGWRWTA